MATDLVSVEFNTRHQVIHGFGFCQAFQRAARMRDMPPPCAQEMLDLLFSREAGAGLSILRLCIGSSADDLDDHHKSIQPTDPGGPMAPARYVWDRNDSGQVWLAKRAQAYGLRRFYASAWSAPGYMKTNGSDSEGGTLYGLPGAADGGVDWREAYAEYLVQYVRFYASEGIQITDLGFTNEPEIARPYATMHLNHEQAVDLAKVVGKVVERSGISLNVVCCDSLGWNFQSEMSAAIEADPEAAARVNIHGAHQYGNREIEWQRLARKPLPTPRPSWMTEWSPDITGDGWNTEWDSGALTDGIRLAENIHDCLTMANVSAYIYWFGASSGVTRALIMMYPDHYAVSKRLWAMAAFSRFIRPGARRVAAHTSAKALKASAYENADSTKAIELLNLGDEALHIDVGVDRPLAGGVVTVYLTDSGQSLARTGVVPVVAGKISVDVPRRALLTLEAGPDSERGPADTVRHYPQ